jgi:hypothetical protein
MLGKRKVKVVCAAIMNDYEIVVSFSDQTTALISVDQLLQAAPARVGPETERQIR